MTEQDLRWNRFIDEICIGKKGSSTLSEIQRKAVLCFWYDAEMNSGGHSGYFDVYPDTVPQELANALATVGYQAIADNYLEAVVDGEEDDFVKTDDAFYEFEPSLSDCLMRFVEENKDAIFN